MIDALHFKAAMQIIPRRRFIGVQDRSLRDARLDPTDRRAFRSEHAGKRFAAMLADDHDNLALAVRELAAIDPVFADDWPGGCSRQNSHHRPMLRCDRRR